MLPSNQFKSKGLKNLFPIEDLSSNQSCLIEFVSPAFFMANCHEHFQTSQRAFVSILDLSGPHNVTLKKPEKLGHAA